MVNVILKYNYTKLNFMSYFTNGGILDGEIELAYEEKLLGTFVDDQEAEKWVESEKENNPIFKRYIDEREELGFAYELVIEKISPLDKNFHIDESLLKF